MIDNNIMIDNHITKIQMPKYSNKLFYTSMLTAVSVLSSYYNNLFYANLRSCSILFTSLLYWYNPIDGWRRKFDMINCNILLGYQLFYTSFFLPSVLCKILYYAISIIVIFCYYMARYNGRKKNPDFYQASIWHSGIHIFGNIANLILYDGIGKNLIGW